MGEPTQQLRPRQRPVSGTVPPVSVDPVHPQYRGQADRTAGVRVRVDEQGGAAAARRRVRGDSRQRRGEDARPCSPHRTVDGDGGVVFPAECLGEVGGLLRKLQHRASGAVPGTVPSAGPRSHPQQPHRGPLLFQCPAQGTAPLGVRVADEDHGPAGFPGGHPCGEPRILTGDRPGTGSTGRTHGTDGTGGTLGTGVESAQ
ncbi:MAG TPA: hypothetical protein DIW82_04950 [Corynebacterium nuruki]|uniref:Uncharacterized protein n=1 Tax=Corynebacterium nuruki TaxID=1032851 RepID=A0A3D4SXZ4_9CORY|nr:hypothetical protein [Corynebacterium nuruki]